MGYTAAGYIDDTCLQGDSFDDWYQNVLATVDIFQKLGFTLHPDKELVCLGFIINSYEMTVRCTKEKAEKMRELCLQIYQRNSIKIRTVAQLLGSMSASFPGVDHVWTFVFQTN